jgi:hypothetical protein
MVTAREGLYDEAERLPLGHHLRFPHAQHAADADRDLLVAGLDAGSQRGNRDDLSPELYRRGEM